MNAERKITVDDVRLGEGHAFDSRMRVKFPVDPPTFATPEGERVLIDESEGWVEVTCTKDGAILVRGAHPLRLEPMSSNTVTVRLLDAEARS